MYKMTQGTQKYVFGFATLFSLLGLLYFIRKNKKHQGDISRKHEDETSKYKTQLEQCRQEKQSIETVNERMKHDRDRADELLQKSKFEVEHLRTETSKFKTELEQCRQEKCSIEAANEKIKHDLDKTDQRLQKSKGDMETLRTETCKLSQENKELHKQNIDLSKKLETYKENTQQRRSLHQFANITFGTSPKPLHNLGNTCFMDAMLQNLAWCPKLGSELQRQIVNMMDIGNETWNEMTYSLFNLVCYCHSTECSGLDKTSVPKAILQAARNRNDIFNGYKQQDSFEMFNTIIDGLKDEMLHFNEENDNITEAEKDIEQIMGKHGAVRLFYGKFLSIFTYTSCKHVESVFQSFTSVTVPIIKRPNKSTVKSESYATSFKYDKPKDLKVKKKKAKKNKNNNEKDHDIFEITQIVETKTELPEVVETKTELPEVVETKTEVTEVMETELETKTELTEIGEQTTSGVNEESSDEEFFDVPDQFKTSITKDAAIQTQNEELLDKAVNTDATNTDDNPLTNPFQALGTIEADCTDIEYGLYNGFMNIETFGEDIMSCRKCKSPSTTGTCYKKTLVAEAPYVLVLHIDRFKENHMGGLVKRNDLVTYPNVLDLKPFSSISMKMSKSVLEKDLRYNLYGVVAHSGSLNSGHYVAYIKTSARSKAHWYQNIIGKLWKTSKKEKCDTELYLEGEKVFQEKMESSQWYYISDEHIMKCTENEALDNQDAYVLMYEKL